MTSIHSTHTLKIHIYTQSNTIVLKKLQINRKYVHMKISAMMRLSGKQFKIITFK